MSEMQKVAWILTYFGCVFAAKTFDFKGQHFRVSVIGTSPYIIYGPKLLGIDVDILDILSKKFDFTYEFKFEKTWGRFDKKSGQWKGTVGSVSLYNFSGQLLHW
jgi:hypothetical protein